jgi:hypothetical protein
MGMNWQPIETAPKDGTPILAWCDHDADPYVADEASQCLTLYAAHAEGMGHVPTGYAIVVWGGGFDDSSYEYPNEANLPDWWFRHGSEFEEAANPTHWMPMPPKPDAALDALNTSDEPQQNAEAVVHDPFPSQSWHGG